MSRLGIAVTVALSLLLAGCWQNDAPDALPPEDSQAQSTTDEKGAALKEIAALMQGSDVYCGIVADLDFSPETSTALRFKSIVEGAARDELDFQRRLAELDVEEILSPASMSTFEGRNASIASIDSLGKLYNDHAFRGSERTLDAINFFVVMGATLDFDPVEVLQSDIKGLSYYLEAMVTAYGQIAVVCNQGDVKLENGTLMFSDGSMVQKYNRAVTEAIRTEQEFQEAYQAVLGARQRMIDEAMLEAQESLQPPEEPITQ